MNGVYLFFYCLFLFLNWRAAYAPCTGNVYNDMATSIVALMCTAMGSLMLYCLTCDLPHATAVHH